MISEKVKNTQASHMMAGVGSSTIAYASVERTTDVDPVPDRVSSASATTSATTV